MAWRLLLTSTLVFTFSGVVLAQNEKLTGKVSRAETRGRTTKLTVDTDTGEQTFELTPKVDLEIVSTGDEGCVAKGLFVKVDCVESNQKFFATSIAVYPDHEGRTPPANPMKAPKEAGQSQNRYFISGEVVEFSVTPEEKYDRLDLKSIGKNTLTVYVERQRTIQVVQTDPSHLQSDQEVVLTGKKAGTKFLPARVTVNTGASLTGDEFQAALKKKK